jgi:hypothetical protein
MVTSISRHPVGSNLSIIMGSLRARVSLARCAPWRAVYRASTLDATLGIPSRWRRQSRDKMGAFSRSTRAQRCRRQLTAHAAPGHVRGKTMIHPLEVHNLRSRDGPRRAHGREKVSAWPSARRSLPAPLTLCSDSHTLHSGRTRDRSPPALPRHHRTASCASSQNILVR